MLEKYCQQVMNLFTQGPKQLPSKETIEPSHVETNKEINYDASSASFVNDLGTLYNEYLYNKHNEECSHATAWDNVVNNPKNTNRLLPEMQLELRRLIKNNNPAFAREAAMSDDTLITNKQAHVESHRPFRKRHHRNKRKFHEIYSPKTKNLLMSQKRENLLSFGMSQDIVDFVIRENQKKNLILASEQPEKREYKDLHNMKVCIIGFPSMKRSELAKKLSDFYGVPHINLQSMAEEFSSSDEIDLDINGENVDLKLLGEKVFNIIDKRCDGYVIEGFPFCAGQCPYEAIDALIYVEFPLEDFIKFQKQKRWCPICTAFYHLEKHPPKGKDPTKCSRCGSDLVIKTKDKEKTIKDMFYLWRTSINDIIPECKNKKRLIEIDLKLDIQDALTQIEREFKEQKIRID